MLVDLIRRIAALMVTLALIFGPGFDGAYAASMHATMASMSNGDMHSGGPCGGCGTAKAGMPVSSCSGACSCWAAFPPDGNFTFGALAAKIFVVGGARHISGRADAPDPYPPRTTDLS